MSFCAIALMLSKTIFGISFIILHHETIASDLGNDAGGGDGETFAVALHNPLGREWKVLHRTSIDQGVIYLCDLSRGARHRSIIGPENIHLINLSGVAKGLPPAEPGNIHQFRKQALTCLFTQFFRIVEPLKKETLWKNYRSGRDRTCEGASSGFINPSHTAESFLLCCSLIVPVRHLSKDDNRLRKRGDGKGSHFRNEASLTLSSAGQDTEKLVFLKKMAFSRWKAPSITRKVSDDAHRP